MVRYMDKNFSWETASSREQAEVVRAASLGEEEAFALLARVFEPALRRLVSFSGVSREEQEDLRQEGLLGLYKACHLFDPAKASFSTFARVCIRSAVLDALRRQAGAEETVPLPDGEEISDSSEDPQRVLMDRERLSSLLEEMDKVLSPRECRILKMRLAGMDGAQIAKSMGIGVRAVDNALFRARAKLKQVDMPE